MTFFTQHNGLISLVNDNHVDNSLNEILVYIRGRVNK